MTFLVNEAIESALKISEGLDIDYLISEIKATIDSTSLIISKGRNEATENMIHMIGGSVTPILDELIESIDEVCEGGKVVNTVKDIGTLSSNIRYAGSDLVANSLDSIASEVSKSKSVPGRILESKLVNMLNNIESSVSDANEELICRIESELELVRLDSILKALIIIKETGKRDADYIASEMILRYGDEYGDISKDCPPV